MKANLWVWFLLYAAISSHACIWDADTLTHEQLRSKDLASAILGEAPPPVDPTPLRARIADLNVHRDETNADWYNNLAGAYLRLNEPAEAVKILEPVVATFPTNYGIHANLGTAYHLLGRYADAEKEIGRDLAINPDAHFGLEKYHLALLQYLMRGTNYQLRHVFVDEFTVSVLAGREGSFREYDEEFFDNVAKDGFTNGLPEAEEEVAQQVKSDGYGQAGELLAEISTLDPKPDYRAKWNLAKDTNFEAGVIYMAQMNPKEPACMTMLGVAAWNKRDYNLAAKAFEKAVALNSPQAGLLQDKISGLNHYIHESLNQKRTMLLLPLVLFSCVFAFGVILIYSIRRLWRRVRPGTG